MKNKKIIGILGAVALVVVPAAAALAESNDDVKVRAEIKPLGIRAELRTDKRVEREDSHDENEQRREDFRNEMKDQMDSLHKDTKVKIESMRVDIKAMKDDGATPEEIKAKVEEVQTSNLAAREEFRTQIEEKRNTLKDEIRAKIDTFKEGVKVKLSEEAKVQVKERLGSAFSKLNDVISKIFGFDERISNEIASRNAKGLDTGEAEAALVLARQSLEEAKVSVDAVSAAVSASIDSDTGASKEAIKSVISTAIESIKLVKAKYQDVIMLLPKIEINTTTTATVESN